MQNTNNPDYLGSVVNSAYRAKEMIQSQLAERLSITTRCLKAIENSR